MLAHRLVSHTGVECGRDAGRVKGSQPVQVLLHYVDGRQPLHEAKNSFGDTKLVIRLQHVLLRAGCFCARVDVHVPKVLRWIVALQVWLDAAVWYGEPPSRRQWHHHVSAPVQIRDLHVATPTSPHPKLRQAYLHLQRRRRHVRLTGFVAPNECRTFAYSGWPEMEPYFLAELLRGGRFRNEFDRRRVCLRSRVSVEAGCHTQSVPRLAASKSASTGPQPTFKRCSTSTKAC